MDGAVISRVLDVPVCLPCLLKYYRPKEKRDQPGRMISKLVEYDLYV